MKISIAEELPSYKELKLKYKYKYIILGHDRLCRAAAVRTSKGHTTQSLVKLVPVELNISDVSIHKSVDTDNPVVSDVTQRQQRVPRRAALNARDTIRAQLMDLSQD